MRRFIRSLLLFVVTLSTLAAPAEACLFIPLLDPFHWMCGMGHQNPAASRQCIDDWLGYGYLRGQANCSLGHYPLQPGSCYTPMFPRLHAPVAPCLPFPRPMMAPAPPVMPQMMAPAPCCPQPLTGGWGGAVATPWPRPMPYRAPYQTPMQPWPMPYQSPTPMLSGIDPCQPDPCQDPCLDPCQDPCQPTPVQVPVTTYRPVTIDCGSWQTVWVPRRVTQMVPQTTWQTQYLPPGGMMGNPMPAQPSIQGGCGDTPCGAATPQASVSSTWPRQMPYSVTTSPGMYSPMAAGGYRATNGMTWQGMPYGSVARNYSPGRPAMMSQPYPMAWRPQPVAANWAAAPTWQPMGSTPMTAGDIMGDHEYPAAAMAPTATGMLPVTPNSYRGSAPIVRTSWSQPYRAASVNKYRNAIR